MAGHWHPASLQLGLADLSSDVRALVAAQASTDEAVADLRETLVDGLASLRRAIQSERHQDVAVMPAKEYADASVQTSSASSCLCSHDPPVDWMDPVTLGQPTRNPAAHEHFARLIQDLDRSREASTSADTRSDSPASYIQLPARMMFPLAYPGELARVNSASRWVTSVTHDAAVSSRSEPAPISDLQTRSISPLSSLSSVDDASMSVSGGPGSLEEQLDRIVRPRPRLDLEDVRADIVVGETLVTGRPKIAREPILAPPAEADDGRLTSSLPTPPSETSSDDRQPGQSARGHDGIATGPTLASRPHLPRILPVIPTPPYLTPEPLTARDRGSSTQSLLARSSGLSPVTPPPLSPLPTVEGLGVGEGSRSRGETRPLVAQKAGARSVVGASDVAKHGPTNDASSIGPQTGRAGVGASFPATNSRVPVITVTHESPRTRQESSVGQLGIQFPEHQTDPWSIGTMDFQIDENEFSFSSPWRRPLFPASATPSRYAIPASPAIHRPTQDGDEVSNALMPGASGTPAPTVPNPTSLPFTFSHDPARASSVCSPSRASQPHPATTRAEDASVGRAPFVSATETFTVHPSMLHGPTSTRARHGYESLCVSRVVVGSSSPLTLLGDVDMSERGGLHDGDNSSSRSNSNATRPRKKPCSVAPTPSARRRGSSEGQRRSESLQSPSASHAASEATVVGAAEPSGRVVGGPSASLEELAMLAKRAPLKIRLKIPETARALKRKRDAVGDQEGGGDAAQERASVHPRVAAPLQGASREGVEAIEADTLSTGASGASHSSAPGTKSKKRIERNGSKKATHAATPAAFEHAHQTKRGTKSRPESFTRYHVRNGQIVAVEPEPAPEPRPESTPTLVSKSGSRQKASTTPSVSKPSVRADEADRDSQSVARARHGKERESGAARTPVPSPSRPRSRSPCVRSSPMREEVWNAISKASEKWPELPEAFTQWDAQFIQCDNCDMWFHYGCVAIKPADPRLKEGTIFICPTCHNQSARRQTLRRHKDTCARSDCPEPQITESTELYFLEKLVGRKKVEGYIHVWLAKWEGFPMTQASWIPKENLVGNDTKLFDTFIEDAEREGADLTQDVVLLREAIKAGWE